MYFADYSVRFTLCPSLIAKCNKCMCASVCVRADARFGTSHTLFCIHFTVSRIHLYVSSSVFLLLLLSLFHSFEHCSLPFFLSVLQLRFYLFSSLHFVPHRKWTFIFDYICQFSKLYYLINQHTSLPHTHCQPAIQPIHFSHLFFSLCHMLSPCTVSLSFSLFMDFLCVSVCVCANC